VSSIIFDMFSTFGPFVHIYIAIDLEVVLYFLVR
jgi:hypothetical protein